ncbi:MAG TPA: FAD-dependent oxidoreductase [Chloroflexota bacterium]|jgi:thioredoxin reductase (NADPH)
MARPVLLAVDDDPNVLSAVERDLRRHYGPDYRIVGADSGTAALETLKQLQERHEPVALLLADQRMPHMTGVGFLAQARDLYPDARRVLLTAYADTDVAIRAINEVRLDYYLQKPWDPPDQQLYPVLDDLLDDWKASYRPAFEGIRAIGTRWAPQSYALRSFLGQHQIPYQWFDAESNAEACALLQANGGSAARLPLVVFPDGTRLEEPTPAALAERLGLATRAQRPYYDVVVVGAGPAGLAAGVYGASEGLSTAIVERDAPGGQAGQSSRIENYLGFPSGLTGGDLARRAVTQARRFGAELLTPQEAIGLRIEDPYRIVRLSDGSEVSCYALLIAAGVSYRKLDAPGIERLTGAGVYYGAALTEALACQGEDVCIVGAANSAGQGAVYFARYARQVTMLVRGESLGASMSQYLVDQITNTPNIAVRTCTEVAEALGDEHLEAVRVINRATGETNTLPVMALAIFIGAQPHTDWLAGVVARDRYGFILTGPDLLRDGKPPEGWPLDRPPYLLETSVPGIFVAGDVRAGSLKRVASGVGEGSVAISFVHRYLASR